MDNELLQAIKSLFSEETQKLKDEMGGELKKIQDEMNDMRNDIYDTKNHVVNIGINLIRMENRMKTVERKLENVETKVTETHLIIENEINKSIGFIADGHVGLAAKLDRMDNTLDEIFATVTALDIVHTKI